MYVYIGSSLKNFEFVRAMYDAFRKEGVFVMYDWTGFGDKGVRTENYLTQADVASLEENGIRTADFVVILLPGGKGTHIELGMALFAGKRVFLVGDTMQLQDPNSSPVFYNRPLVTKIFLDVRELKALEESPHASKDAILDERLSKAKSAVNNIMHQLIAIQHV